MFCSINSLLLPHKYLFHQKKSSMHTFLIFDLSSLTFLYVSTTVFKLFFFFFHSPCVLLYCSKKKAFSVGLFLSL